MIDAAELCRNVHPSSQYRQAAEDCFEQMSDYINQLNTDVRLYDSLANMGAADEVMSKLNIEQKRMVMLLKEEFENNGIHLDDAGRQRVRELQSAIARIGNIFNHTINTDVGSIEVSPEEAKHLPPSVRAALQSGSHSTLSFLSKPQPKTLPTDVSV